MKFVETYLTRYHLFHKPHKWFLAFLVSPIHAAEIHYKRKYHLTFAHAKKLFLFDMLLLGSTLFLLVGTIFWFTYDPTVRELVSISISSTEKRVQSGDYTTYTIHYENNSDVTLTDVRIALSLPEGFDIASTSPYTITEQRVFALPNLVSGAQGTVSLSGWFYDVPEQENTITATFSYVQEGETRREIKARQALTTLRGSVLQTVLSTSDTILGQGTTPVTLTLTNTGLRPLSNVTVPLPTGELRIRNIQVPSGTVSGSVWQVGNLDPEASVSLSGTLVSAVARSKQTIPLAITPTIDVRGTTLAQATIAKQLRVSHPAVIIQTTLTDDSATALPGAVVPMNIAITNTGDTTLTNVVLTIPLSNTIQQNSMRQENFGRLTAEGFRITQAEHAALRQLAPGTTAIIPIRIPVSFSPTGTHIRLFITPSIKATIPTVPQSVFTYTADASPEVKIGSQLLLQASSRYYTNEGDQLGRGPLPPKVGKETKYWVIIELQNTSNKIQNLSLNATLPNYVTWTGKSSVSHGADVTYDNASRRMSWRLNSLSPYQTVGIYVELSITPTPADRGTTPVLLENIRATANDVFIEAPIFRTHPPIDISLPNDVTGQQKGVRVQ